MTVKKLKKNTDSEPKHEDGTEQTPGQESGHMLTDTPESEGVETADYKAQFPSTAGEPEVEIAKRSADVHTLKSDVYLKDYVVQGRSFSDTEEFHSKQYNAMRQEAINNGLRLQGDVRFVEAVPHEDGVSMHLWYEVPATPAAIAEGLVAHSPADQERAHQLEEKSKTTEDTDN